VIKTLPSQHKNFQQKLLIAWVGITFAFALVIIYVVWQTTYSKMHHKFSLEAHTSAFELEELFGNIVDSLDSVPMYSDQVDACKKNLNQLQKIVFNSLYLSGIVIISSDYQILCKTEGTLKTLPEGHRLSGPILLGPVQQDPQSNKLYYLQKNYGEYHVGGFFIKKVLDDVFRQESKLFQFIGLYDTHRKKMVYINGNSTGKVRLNLATLPANMSNEMIRHNPENQLFEAIIPLNSVDNLALVFSKSKPLFFKNLGRDLLLYLLPLLLLSWWFFNYSKKLVKKRFSIDNAMYTALKDKQFYPVYQAVYNITTNRFTGAEVLIRWKTDNDEIILPDYFIEEAEKSGLIVPITLQLIETVFDECQPLFEEKIPFKLSFNISPAHFNDKNFFHQFYELCARYHVPASQIMFELTERGLFNQSDTDLVHTMQELRRRGFSLGLDDFGTGQANITYLQHFPFNYLKIDQIFIKTIGTGAIIESINQSIITMARGLKLDIIAEGVETEAQVNYLRENQVNYIQGWFYAKAMPYEDFAKLFRQH
jgi:sensor c-di-GMP phosphodiesterase-like protein